MRQERSRSTDRCDEAFGLTRNKTFVGIVLLSVSALALLWVAIFGVTSPYLEMFLTVVPLSAGAAAIAGLTTGLLTAAAGGLSGWYLILPPEMSFRLNNQVDAYCLIIVSALAVLMCIVARNDRPGVAGERG